MDGAFRIGLAGQLFDNTATVEPNTPADTNGDTNARSRIDLAIRASGFNVADMINFDLFYKVTGGDPTLPGKADDDKEADGKGKWRNSFGIYVGLGNLVDGLGIGIGYSASVLVQEATMGADKATKNLHPFYNGIDLRFQFTGVDKLRVTFNNNFSFAATKGLKAEDGTFAPMITIPGAPTFADKGKESWFAMHNALALRYAVTEKVFGNFEISNRAGWYSQNNDEKKYADVITDQLGITLFATYVFSPNITMESGLAMEVRHTTSKKIDSDPDRKEQKYGQFRFGIPVRFRFAW